MSKSWFLGSGMALCMWAHSLPAAAADADTHGDRPVTATDLYDRATAAYNAGAYRKAAQWFEDAAARLPDSDARWRAAQAHRRAGNHVRAATLALVVAEEESDPATAAKARKMVDRYRDKLTLVIMECGGCRIELDGTVQEESPFFVRANTVHRLAVEWSGGIRVRLIQGQPGEELAFGFTSFGPESGIRPEDAAALAGPRLAWTPEEPNDGVLLPPLATYVGAGVTAALLAASLAYTVSALNGVDEYKEAARTYATCEVDCETARSRAEDLLQAGRGRELMTGVTWVATGVAATVTTVLAVFLTDWEGRGAPEAELRFGLRAPRSRADTNLLLSGAF